MEFSQQQCIVCQHNVKPVPDQLCYGWQYIHSIDRQKPAGFVDISHETETKPTVIYKFELWTLTLTLVLSQIHHKVSILKFDF